MKTYILGGILFLAASPLFAISGNKVRVTNFNWMTVETDHFIVHYDSSTQDLLPDMVRYLEGAWQEVGDILNFHVPEKTPFFFFSNHNEFEQNNIVSVGEGTGGVTEAFKNRFLIYNDGSQTWLRHVIYHEYGHVVQFNVIYGGWWKSIRLLKSPFYPLWLMEGMAEFVSGDIDRAVEDMVVRDGVYHNTLPNLPELQGFGHLRPNQVTLAYKTGNAAMDFLADEYGHEKVGEFLQIIKDFFDVSSALYELVGCDLGMFDYRFQEYLRDKYHRLFARGKEPHYYGKALTTGDGIPQSNQGYALSPNGKKMYYISDQHGPSFIYELDLASKKKKVIQKLTWGSFENIQNRGRAMSVSRDGRWLAFAGEKNQKDFLYLYDLEHNHLEKIKVPFDQIRSPVFSPTHDLMVCVGMIRGFNDLYLIDREGNKLARLTNNRADEKDPVFSPDGQRIAYSGEVMDLNGETPMGRNLFEVDSDSKEIQQLTNFTGEDTEPTYIDDKSLVFVRNVDNAGELGFNLYRLNRNTLETFQMTDFIGGGFSPRYSRADQSLYFVGFNNGERHIYKYGASLTAKADDTKSHVPNKISKKPPVSYKVVKSTHSKATIVVSSAPVTEVSLASASVHADEFLDADQEDAWKKKVRDEKGRELTMMLDQPRLTDSMQPILATARPYRFRGSTDLFIPFIFYSTLDGLVFANIWQYSDYLGNHQVQQQLQFASGNDYSDLSVFYSYARFRPRFSVGVRHLKYFKDIDMQNQRKEIQGIALATYPLDRVKSVSLGVGITDQKETYLNGLEDDVNLQDRFYILGYAHDTVTGRYLVPTKGRRFAASFQQAREIFGGQEEYKTGTLQYVQYVPLPRESTVVGRLLYGRSTGDSPQVFRLGGVDRVRGVSRGALTNKKTNAMVGTIESRLRLSYLNWRTHFLFPDFFFKAAYLVLFTDAGYGWNNSEERGNFEADNAFNSVGAGISWPTFILQTFQMNLTVQYARRTDTDSEIWYITIGPTF
jgi:Tol biopolymer transport system component